MRKHAAMNFALFSLAIKSLGECCLKGKDVSICANESGNSQDDTEGTTKLFAQGAETLLLGRHRQFAVQAARVACLLKLLCSGIGHWTLNRLWSTLRDEMWISQ
jgi:hypothetical protein